MATLYVTEYQSIATPSQIPQEPAVNTQTASIGASAASVTLSANTHTVRLHTDAICSVLITNGGTAATAASPRMAANQTEYRGVTPGQIISVITNT